MAEAIVDTLLASTEPSIRWKTRVHVLCENPASRAVKRLEREIRDSPRVRALLARRDARGRLVHKRDPYAKWDGAHWILAALADIHGMDQAWQPVGWVNGPDPHFMAG